MSLSKIRKQLEDRFPETAFSVNQYPNQNPSIVWVGNPATEIVEREIEKHRISDITFHCMASKSQAIAIIRAMSGDYGLDEDLFRKYCTRIGVNVIGKKCRMLSPTNCVGWTVELDDSVSDEIKDSLNKRLLRYRPKTI